MHVPPVPWSHLPFGHCLYPGWLPAQREYARLPPSSHPIPAKGYPDVPGRPVETPEGTVAGNACLALAEPHGVDRCDRCCWNAWGTLHTPWGLGRVEIWAAFPGGQGHIIHWTLSHEQPHKSWTTKTKPETGKGRGKYFFLQKGHGRVLKTILIWSYHSQGLFWGTDLHRSTNQLQFQSKAVQVSDWKYHWDLKLNTQDYIELGMWTVSCSHTFHHYDPHLYLNKVMPSNLRKKTQKTKTCPPKEESAFTFPSIQ